MIRYRNSQNLDKEAWKFNVYDVFINGYSHKLSKRSSLKKKNKISNRISRVLDRLFKKRR